MEMSLICYACVYIWLLIGFKTYFQYGYIICMQDDMGRSHSTGDSMIGVQLIYKYTCNKKDI